MSQSRHEKIQQRCAHLSVCRNAVAVHDIVVTATGFTLQVMGGAAAWAVKTAEAVKTDDR